MNECPEVTKWKSSKVVYFKVCTLVQYQNQPSRIEIHLCFLQISDFCSCLIMWVSSGLLYVVWGFKRYLFQEIKMVPKLSITRKACSLCMFRPEINYEIQTYFKNGPSKGSLCVIFYTFFQNKNGHFFGEISLFYCQIVHHFGSFLHNFKQKGSLYVFFLFFKG